MPDALVIGSGIGGLAAATVLASRGLSVEVVEAAHRPGGKAGTVVVDGVEVDTGPSVLTLPDAFEPVFQAAGTRLADEVTLRRLDPGFRYRWPDGTVLDVFHAREDTLASVRAALGSEAERDLRAFLDYARRIWDIAAPHFVLGEAPTLGRIWRMGPRMLAGLPTLDPLRTMQEAIASQVRSPHLRDVLARYATYNGSDPRRAPATLNCIAHVELSVGAWGVEGGIGALVGALVRVAVRAGVRFRYGARAARIETRGAAVAGLILADGSRIDAGSVVVNADPSHLLAELLPGDRTGLSAAETPSTSGWTGILRARRRQGPEARIAHEILFPGRYAEEFADLFDRDRPPGEPTVYLCAQEAAHGRAGWDREEPVFVMANAPAEPSGGPRDDATWTTLRDAVVGRLRASGLSDPGDRLVWERTPSDLAARFPGSRGAIYGAASNTMFAAFRRPANRVRAVRGLYLASGGAHPGGGLPMVARSGLTAATALLADREAS